MFIPQIYTGNVVLLFSSLLIGFAVYWGITKAIKLLNFN